MKPLIGICAGTIYNKERPDSPFTYGQSHTYVEAVSMSGGIPVIIPITKTEAEVKDIFERLDGILFSGGNDVSTDLYGEEVRFALEIDKPRDTHEVALMKMALSTHTPILAICRGMQLLNVVRGGTLYQDIVNEIPESKNHDGNIKEEEVEHVLHALMITPESQLAKILNVTNIDANTFHHQAVKQVGQGLNVSARADDGIIEGIEDMTEGFVIGVQPHPESLVSQNIRPEWKPLFESFIEASKSSSDIPG